MAFEHGWCTSKGSGRAATPVNPVERLRLETLCGLVLRAAGRDMCLCAAADPGSPLAGIIHQVQRPDAVVARPVPGLVPATIATPSKPDPPVLPEPRSWSAQCTDACCEVLACLPCASRRGARGAGMQTAGSVARGGGLRSTGTSSGSASSVAVAGPVASGAMASTSVLVTAAAAAAAAAASSSAGDESASSGTSGGGGGGGAASAAAASGSSSSLALAGADSSREGADGRSSSGLMEVIERVARASGISPSTWRVRSINSGGFNPVHVPATQRHPVRAAVPLLPPLAPAHSGRMCLVLDLDETLVHSSFKPVANADMVIPVRLGGAVHPVHVMKRPGCDEFLRVMAERFEVVIFTASVDYYANPLLDRLDPDHRFISHRLFREACVLWQGNYIKDMSLLGRPEGRSIIVDNSPASYLLHPQNAIPCTSFFDDKTDTELGRLARFLRLIADDDPADVTRHLAEWALFNELGVTEEDLHPDAPSPDVPRGPRARPAR